MNNIRSALITSGVKNCQEFGYPLVTDKNILTDVVYRKTFLIMLKDDTNNHPVINAERLKLIEEIISLGDSE